MVKLNLSKVVLSAAKSAAMSIEALEGGGLGGSHEATRAGSRTTDPALVCARGGQSTAHFPGVPDHTQLVSLRNENLSGEDRIVEIGDGHAATAEVLANDRLGAMQIAQQQVFTEPRLCEVPEAHKLLPPHSEKGTPSTIYATGVAYDEIPGAPGGSTAGKVTTTIER